MYNFWIVNYNPWLTYLFSISTQTVHLYATDGTCILCGEGIKYIKKIDDIFYEQPLAVHKMILL